MSLSIQSSLTGMSLAGFQNNVTVSASASKSASTNEENTASSATAVSADGDTLELSAAGTALEKKTFEGVSKNSGVSEDEGYTDSMAELISSAASSAGINEYTNSVDSDGSVVSSSDSTSDLSSYTESELKEMLENGEITRAEYEKEIAARQSGSSEDEESELQAEAEVQE